MIFILTEIGNQVRKNSQNTLARRSTFYSKIPYSGLMKKCFLKYFNEKIYQINVILAFCNFLKMY